MAPVWDEDLDDGESSEIVGLEVAVVRVDDAACEIAEVVASPVTFRARKGAASVGLLLKYAAARSFAEQRPAAQGSLLQHPQNGGLFCAHVKKRPPLHC